MEAEPLLENSSLVERLFRDATERRLEVLDLAGAVPETLAYLAEFGCRVHCADLLVDLDLEALEPPEESDEQSWCEAEFARRLEFMGDTTVDVCLLWDYPNYLSPNQLLALGRVLTPHFHTHTRGLAFAALNTRETLASWRYGIANEHQLSLRSVRHAPPQYAHSQSVIADNLRSLRVEKSALKGGRVEVLLESR